MALTKVLFQDLQNDIVPAGQDTPMVWASKYYGTNALWQAWFFPFAPSSVQQYANLAAFPVTGVANVLYIDSTTNEAYEWNGTSYDLLSNNEVQSYTNVAWFPATGSEWVTYIDLTNDDTYIWDAGTSTYVLQGGGVVAVPVQDTFTLTAGGTTLTLTSLPVASEHTVVIRNGLELTSGATRDYTLSGNVVTLINPAFATDLFTVKYYA